jgi:hypothetical protein
MDNFNSIAYFSVLGEWPIGWVCRLHGTGLLDFKTSVRMDGIETVTGHPGLNAS